MAPDHNIFRIDDRAIERFRARSEKLHAIAWTFYWLALTKKPLRGMLSKGLALRDRFSAMDNLASPIYDQIAPYRDRVKAEALAISITDEPPELLRTAIGAALSVHSAYSRYDNSRLGLETANGFVRTIDRGRKLNAELKALRNADGPKTFAKAFASLSSNARVLLVMAAANLGWKHGAHKNDPTPNWAYFVGGDSSDPRAIFSRTRPDIEEQYGIDAEMINRTIDRALDILREMRSPHGRSDHVADSVPTTATLRHLFRDTVAAATNQLLTPAARPLKKDIQNVTGFVERIYSDDP